MMGKKMFREYDIRGVWGKDLTEDAVERIGKAFAVYLRQNTSSKEDLTVTLGRDVRLSSPSIFDRLAKSLVSSGIDVIDIGVCPTPLQYFSLHILQVDGGIMITGSHNPPEFNGMKLSVGKETIYGNKIQEISGIIDRGESLSGAGHIREHDIAHDYIEHMRKAFRNFEKIRVVIDAGNGTAGLVARYHNPAIDLKDMK